MTSQKRYLDNYIKIVNHCTEEHYEKANDICVIVISF